MAVKGTEAKSKLTNALLSIFANSFVDGKIVRIPIVEDGEVVEIKLTLTAAKDILGGEPAVKNDVQLNLATEPTQEEIENVKKLLETLNL